jgi:hypothetical protein
VTMPSTPTQPPSAATPRDIHAANPLPRYRATSRQPTPMPRYRATSKQPPLPRYHAVPRARLVSAHAAGDDVWTVGREAANLVDRPHCGPCSRPLWFSYPEGPPPRRR